MRPYHEEFAGLVTKLQDWVSIPPDDAVEVIAPAGRSKDYVETWPGISPYVIPSVLWSLYSFLRNPDSYWEAVATSISVGGDVDTTGAMTGAISGASLGLSALPQQQARAVNDRVTWTHDDLVQLADQCFELAVGT
jgi:ADP-ribosylglycohydrolase